MTIRTHPDIDRPLCGTPCLVEPGHARVELTTTSTMAVDNRGLVHGGFIFGLADYAAMLAVNDPNVVLASADVKFTRPVVVSNQIVADARVEEVNGKKHRVAVSVCRTDEIVFSGTFTCFVLQHHVLDRS